MGGHFSGKTFVVLITYRYHCASTVAFFERICPFFDIPLNVITCRTMDVDTENDILISSCTEELTEAYDLGRRIGSV